MDRDTYIKSLQSITQLGLLLVRVPDKVPTTIRLQGALLAMEEGLLKVQIAILEDSLDSERRGTQ